MKKTGIILSEDESRNVVATYTTAHPCYWDTVRLFGSSTIPTPFFNLNTDADRLYVLSEIQRLNPEIIVIWKVI